MVMLGEPGTTAYIAQTPLPVAKGRDTDGKRTYWETPSEVGGVTIVAARNSERTTFVALHKPFQKDQPDIADFTLVGRTNEVMVVSVTDGNRSGINDRLMLRLGGGHDETTTVTRGRESFTFKTWAYMRITDREVRISGDLQQAEFPAKGHPKVLLNGKPQESSASDGYVTISCRP